MYTFGVDIPLVELFFGFFVIGIIVLVEITFILILITYQLRNSKKLGGEIRRLSHTLMRLEDKELKGLAKLNKLEDKEIAEIEKLRKLKR
jgi:hypothetical protein